jgi:hypothetical protein
MPTLGHTRYFEVLRQIGSPLPDSLIVMVVLVGATSFGHLIEPWVGSLAVRITSGT